MLRLIILITLCIIGMEAGSQLVTKTGDIPYRKVINSKQLKCLTDNIYFESRGESVRGQMAVALVTLNRKFSDKYPDTICEVVYEQRNSSKCQFSWVCKNESYKKVRDIKSYLASIAIAEMIIANYDHDIDLTYGANHYHEIDIKPFWASADKVTTVIGKHKFYKL
jgi:spore germination cell wall hydrolase CwlJ-like protein